jgi:AraC-like DNA-binding protein
MHPSTFRRKMVALTGTPPAQYIMRRRVEQACAILADYPNVTISDVAERCGFSDSAHFAHVFRRFYNTTPLQWLKNGGAKGN